MASERRLLGYVVKLPDGTRSPRTPKPASLANIVLSWCSGRAAEPLVVVPVFAVRKSVVVPTQVTTEAEVRAFNALDPKPAPVVAGERYACWAGVCMWLTDGEDDPRDTGTRAEAEARAAGIPGAKVVRILDDGEHEAAVAKAREESRLSGLAEARSIVKAHKRTMTPRTPSDSALGAVLVTLRDAEKAAAEAKYKDRDVEVMRVALADLRRIRACFVARANSLRTIGEVARASGLEDAIKQLDEEVFT